MLPFDHLQKSNTRDNLWIYILFLLRKGQLYGWEIPSLIEDKFGFKPGKITPYRVLYRLEEDGYVKSKMDDRRRVYQITEKGKKESEKAREFYEIILEKL